MAVAAMEQNLIQKAFFIDLIRERILTHVVWKPNDEDEYNEDAVKTKVLSMCDLRSIRLVSREWLSSTTRILRRDREPLMTIGKSHAEETSVHDFVGGMIRQSSLYNVENHASVENEIMVPPYFLKLYSHFFTQENGPVLLNCLQKLGSGMVELKIQFPVDATISFQQFISFRLPRLQQVTVDVTELLLSGDDALPPEELEMNGSAVPSRNFLELLQLVLGASRELTHLVFSASDFDEDDEEEPKELFYFPRTLPQLVLPATLTHIQFETSVKVPHNLEVLVAPQNTLPRLSFLKLYAFQQPFDTELIFRILNKVRHSLCHLHLEGAKFSEGLPLGGAAMEQTNIRFPCMPCLRNLRVLSARWNVMAGVTHLTEKFPKLETITLKNCPEDTFIRRWLNESVYGSVERLTLSLVGIEEARFQGGIGEQEQDIADEDDMVFPDHPLEEGDLEDIDEDEDLEYGTADTDSETDDEQDETNELDVEDDEEETVYIVLPSTSQRFPTLPITPEQIQRVRVAFPNLRILNLACVTSEETLGLMSLFTEFRNITHLDLRMADKPPSDLYWDSVLTGLSTQRVEQLKGALEALKEPRLALSREDLKVMLGSRAAGPGTPSICRLANLTNFLIACPAELQENEVVPVISDLAFYLAFLRMPQLQKLELAGGFKPSEDMLEEWRNVHGGDPLSIVYFPRTC